MTPDPETLKADEARHQLGDGDGDDGDQYGIQFHHLIDDGSLYGDCGVGLTQGSMPISIVSSCECRQGICMTAELALVIAQQLRDAAEDWIMKNRPQA